MLTQHRNVEAAECASAEREAEHLRGFHNVCSCDVSMPGRAARRQAGCNCAAMSYKASARFSSQGGVSSAPTEAAAAWECRALLQLFVCSVTEKVIGFNLP